MTGQQAIGNCTLVAAVCLMSLLAVESLTQGEKDLFLNYHNEVRRSVVPAASNMQDMVYDEELEVLAQKWVNRCKFEHPSRSEEEYRLSGQNLGATGGLDGEASIRKVMKMWYDENKDYNYDRNSCKGVCGHYTQMVWWNSNRIGCAMKTCSGIFPGMKANFIACQYVARGNYIGQRPYAV
ncbi:SCP / Tpx-1 / Ag5 / PR-1 / Sc7 of extracellular domains [Sparganum proliferum]